MANSAVQIVALVLCIASALCTLIAVILPNWRQNDVTGEIIEAIIRHQGLWIRCVTQATGIWSCDDYDSFFLGLPVQLQIARGLAIIAIVCSFFGLLLSIVGMECTNCLSQAKKTKSRMAFAAGAFWIASGLSIGIAASYYAHEIVQDYNFATNLGGGQLQGGLSNNQVQRFVFGSSLFLGWASLAVGTAGGAIMMCGSRYVESHEDEIWNRGKMGQGVRRMRNSFRSFRGVRPNRYSDERDYV